MMEIFNWSTQGWSLQRSDIRTDTTKPPNTCRYEKEFKEEGYPGLEEI